MRRVPHFVWVVGVISMLSLFIVMYSLIQIYSEKNDQNRLLSDWELENVMVKEAGEELLLDQLIQEVSPSTKQATNDVDDPELSETKSNTKQDPIPNELKVLGKITIPKLKKKWAIIEGTGNRQLAKGIGHYEGSAFPGDVGNSILAGHRESGLMKLGKVEVGDQITIETFDGSFIYEVEETKIVDKEDKSINISSDKPLLTLVTCYPLEYFGPSPDRFIVSAALLSKNK